jgi:hypothetical protein
VKKALDLSRPDGWDVTYVVPLIAKDTPATTAAPAATASTPTDDEATKELKELDEKVEKLKIDTLNSLSKGKKDGPWNALYTSMTADGGGDNKPSLPLLIAKLCHVDRESTRKDNLSAVVEVADVVMGRIDQVQLSSKLGLRVNDDDEAAVAEKKKLETEKGYLIDAMFRKTRAQLDMNKLAPAAAADGGGGGETTSKTAPAAESDFDVSFKLLQQWENVLDPKQASKYSQIALGYFTRADKVGGLLKYVNAVLKDEKVSKDLEAQMRAVQSKTMAEMGWSWMAQYDDAWALINRPQSYTLH